jgi:ribonuclease R
MKIKKESFLNAVRRAGEAGAEFRDLMRFFGVNKGQRHDFLAYVDRLAADGSVVRLKGNRLKAATPAYLITGRLTVHRDGFGFVVPDGDGDDIFIPARYLRESLHGDRVEARVVAVKIDGKREGRVVRTLERGMKRLVGSYREEREGARVVADDPRIAQEILIPRDVTGGAQDGQTVVAEITAYPAEGRRARGRIAEVLGWPEEPETEFLSIVRKHDLPCEFPQEVLAAAALVPQAVSAADLAGRVDLRGEPTVTIDGETAKDFDDAVSVQREERGRISLRVSIADVSHYVAPGSALDVEALRRGTSVYFPGRCIPMLPEALSNEICSLNPGVDRLTMTAELRIDPAGRVEEASFYPSVIRSAARLTYTEVRKVLVDKDAETLAARAELVPQLRVMEELALRLMARRRERGSIDFDLPEPEIVLDLQGETRAIVRAERNLAHRIIEEFMLAANEAVAGHVETLGIPSLYRVHEPPEMTKLEDFREFVREFGFEFRLAENGVASGEFQRLLLAVEGKPEERLINQVLLRSMKQARYAAENMGHFGLAAPCYTHFTSPIRRYPDLEVHRILRGVLAGTLRGKRVEQLEAVLPEIADQASKRERVAMEAEREIVTLKKLQFMRDKVGEEYDGFVTGVTPHGFFVELVDLFVEGMVHVSALPPDFYRFEEKRHLLAGERTRTSYRLGDRVRVRVANVSLTRREIDFVPAGVDMATVAAVAEQQAYPRIPVKGKPIRRERAGNREKPQGKGRGKGRGGKGAGPRRGR